MPPSPQYRPAGPPGAAGGATTAVARPGRPGPVQAPPPVMVTSELARPAEVWITTELFTKPLMCENPVADPRRPAKVREKKHVSSEGLCRIGGAASPPAPVALVEGVALHGRLAYITRRTTAGGPHTSLS